MSAENHNRLASQLLAKLIQESGSEAEAMVVLESLIMGVLLYFRPKPREAAVFLDSLTERVIERMAEDAAR